MTVAPAQLQLLLGHAVLLALKFDLALNVGALGLKADIFMFDHYICHGYRKYTDVGGEQKYGSRDVRHACQLVERQHHRQQRYEQNEPAVVFHDVSAAEYDAEKAENHKPDRDAHRRHYCGAEHACPYPARDIAEHIDYAQFAHERGDDVGQKRHRDDEDVARKAPAGENEQRYDDGQIGRDGHERDYDRAVVRGQPHAEMSARKHRHYGNPHRRRDLFGEPPPR